MAAIYVRSTDGNDADDGSTWALAKATLAGALAIATNADTIYVSQAHAETAGSAKALTFPTSVGLKVICGDDAAAPPTSTATTATVTTTGNFAVTFASGFADIYGVSFASGTGNSGSADMVFGTANATTSLNFVSCNFSIPSTSTSSPYQLGSDASNRPATRLTFTNCKFKFGSTSQKILASVNAYAFFRGCSIDGSGSDPTSLITYASTSQPSRLTFMDCDLTDAGTATCTNLVDVSSAGYLTFVDFLRCRIPTSVNVTTGTFGTPSSPVVRLHNCDSGDTNLRVSENTFYGVATTDTSVYMTNGSTCDSVGFSQKLAPSANVTRGFPLRGFPLSFEQTSVGSSITVTMNLVFDQAADVTDAEFWFEIHALSTSGYPQGVISTSAIATPLTTPTNLTSSTETWTGTGGFSNAKKRKVAITFTPQEKGFFQVVPCIGIDLDVYVDMLAVVS